VLGTGTRPRFVRWLSMMVIAGAFAATLLAGGPARAARSPAATTASCPPGRLGTTAGVTGTYSGTWTYEFDQSEPSPPDIISKETLNWSESLNGNTSGCWTLNSVGGSASVTGAGSGPGGDCSATISARGDGASNFIQDQLDSAGQAAYLSLENLDTGATDGQHWYLYQAAPNYYDEPEGIIQTSDSDPQDFCFEPNNGNQPINNGSFTGGNCHIGGGSTDYLTLLTHGGGSASDSCSFTSTDGSGGTITETFSDSVTLTSVVPTCSDTSATVKAGKQVTIPISCSISISDPLEYRVSTQPAHGYAYGGASSPSVFYSADQNFKGTDSFTFVATAVNGLSSDPATVTVNVQKKNKAKHKKKKPGKHKKKKKPGKHKKKKKPGKHKKKKKQGKHKKKKPGKHKKKRRRHHHKK
jgi:hypothetical protein